MALPLKDEPGPCTSVFRHLLRYLTGTSIDIVGVLGGIPCMLANTSIVPSLFQGNLTDICARSACHVIMYEFEALHACAAFHRHMTLHCVHKVVCIHESYADMA